MINIKKQEGIIVTNSEIYLQFGKRLASLRQEKGMSQSELAKKLGIPQSTYAGYEIGKRKINLGLIKRIADFFAVPQVFLFIGADVQNNQMQKETRQYSQNEELLIKKYRALDERGKLVVNNVIDAQLKTIYPKMEDSGG